MMVELARRFLGCNRDCHRAQVNFYNEWVFPLIEPERKYRMTYNDDWCAMFVSNIGFLAGQNPSAFPYEVSCYYMMNKAMTLGTFYRDVERIKRNDLVLYDWTGRDAVPRHVGIVESTMYDDRILVIEGNKGWTVDHREVTTKNPQLRGFIRVPMDTIPVNLGIVGT